MMIGFFAKDNDPALCSAHHHHHHHHHQDTQQQGQTGPMRMIIMIFDIHDLYSLPPFKKADMTA